MVAGGKVARRRRGHLPAAGLTATGQWHLAAAGPTVTGPAASSGPELSRAGTEGIWRAAGEAQRAERGAGRPKKISQHRTFILCDENAYVRK